MTSHPRAALDHIILGVDDLDRGIRWVEERTGVRASLGGVHPGRGTRNALLALGPDCYLEIIAPDPEQGGPKWFVQILSMSEPRLLAWAAHTDHLAEVAQIVESAGMEIDGIRQGARTRPDGKTLRWQLFHLLDDRGGLLPFFIEWDGDSEHPSGDAPQGCRLENFEVHAPAQPTFESFFQSLSMRIAAVAADDHRLVVRISSPKGEVELTS